MDYTAHLQYHYKPTKGWISDPNGLIYYKDYYHIFYQHSPNYDTPWHEPMHWGHAVTKDFLSWEELPVALYPDKNYDCGGCWSGTAIEKDGILYLMYASVYTPPGTEERIQTVSIAYSEDGINFKKYEDNPVIKNYPAEGGPDFRDPAVTCIDGKYYCVMATGHRETQKARLVLYKSDDLLNWDYKGVMSEWDNCKFAECPSFMKCEDSKYLLTASVCPLEEKMYFSVMYGTFEKGEFKAELSAEIDKGPDQYAGQVFRDKSGRNILMSWIPGWLYTDYEQNRVGCMSVPRQIFVEKGKIYAYPVSELRHFLKSDDEALKVSDNGFSVARTNRKTFTYQGVIRDIQVLRDEYILEIYVNGGEEVYSVLL